MCIIGMDNEKQIAWNPHGDDGRGMNYYWSYAFRKVTFQNTRKSWG